MNEEPITRFDGEYFFLSNFSYNPIEFESISYRTVEHAYQAAKTLIPEVRMEISKLRYAGQAKRQGRKVELRDDWQDIKLEVMRELLEKKFRIPKLRKLLAQTYRRELIEGNTWGDTFWGQCPIGKGENHLGQILMSIRAQVIDNG